MSHFGATNCLQKTKDCEAQMRENIGEAMACGDCVCSVKNPESCAHKNDTQNHICEGKIDYEGKEVYNCVLAPDREKCIETAPLPALLAKTLAACTRAIIAYAVMRLALQTVRSQMMIVLQLVILSLAVCQ
jgi:hypothetical protein